MATIVLEISMSPRSSLNRLVRSAVVGVAGVRAQVEAVAYFFYGYWFSQRRA
nr:hypothetical protein [Pseudomonas sp. UBA6718]